jgi:hypothetical protein
MKINSKRGQQEVKGENGETTKIRDMHDGCCRVHDVIMMSANRAAQVSSR